MDPEVGDHGELVPEGLAALAALPRLVAGVLQQVVVQVDPRLERFITVGALELSNIFVYGVDMRLQSALLREVLATEFTPYLSADTVGSQVVS